MAATKAAKLATARAEELERAIAEEEGREYKTAEASDEGGDEGGSGWEAGLSEGSN